MHSFKLWLKVVALCLWSSIADSSLAGTIPRSRVNIDHLVPVGQMVGAAYQRLLARQLYLTPANYARIVVIPSGSSSGETAVSLYSNGARQDKVFLTKTSGESDLWSAASEIDPLLGKDPQIKIRRLDAPFPKSLAVSISTALRRLIRKSHNPVSTDRLTVDGTHILYIVEESGGRILKARLTPESEGRITGALRKLTYFLGKYGDVAPVYRKGLEKQMEAELKHLNN
jgi:hypothetical protein